MTAKTKILMALCLIASAGVVFDLYRGMMNNSFENGEIAIKTIVLTVCLWYVFRNIAGRSRRD